MTPSLISARLLGAWLFLAPPPADYAGSRAGLDAALEGIGHTNTDESLAAIEEGIAALASHPAEVSTNLDALELLDRARMSLVWLHLAAGDTSAAEQAMDAALRASRGHSRSAGNFGPMVRDLYDERLALLDQAGTAIVEVDCRIPCQVVVDERRSANPTEPLYLGPHSIWVSARQANVDDVQWTLYEVDLSASGMTELLVFQPAMDLQPSEVIEPPPPPAIDAAKPKKRLLPRWAEIVAASLGAGLVVSGAVLLGLDGQCASEVAGQCKLRWENSARGAAILGVGGAVLLGSGALLTVDEVRVRGTKAKQVMLTWTLRF